jgi:hypothetical protein
MREAAEIDSDKEILLTSAEIDSDEEILLTSSTCPFCWPDPDVWGQLTNSEEEYQAGYDDCC